MKETEISMSELRQRLGDLVNRVAYGKERIILVSHGQPKAAIIGVDDLHRLQNMKEDLSLDERYARSLDTARQIRERLSDYQETSQVQAEDSTETLRRLREENHHEPDHLH